MREIKFRVWDVLEKKIHKPNEFRVMSNPVDRIDFFIGGDFKTRLKKQFILMQYTGLKDKNGKEIYEGDIIRAESNNTTTISSVNGVSTLYRIVVWLEDEAQFGWELSSGEQNQSGFSLCKSNENILEVIGNIYENPELLKQ